jgi:hypothetical protein
MFLKTIMTSQSNWLLANKVFKKKALGTHKLINTTKARFTLGVRADVQPKLSIPISAKVEISPNGFTLGVKAELEKTFSICPKLLINAELYGLILAPRLEKGYNQIWEANLQPLGPNNKPKMLKVGPKFCLP